MEWDYIKYKTWDDNEWLLEEWSTIINEDEINKVITSHNDL